MFLVQPLADASYPTCYSLSKYFFHEHGAKTVIVSLYQIETESLVEIKRWYLFLFIQGIKSDFLVACILGKI